MAPRQVILDTNFLFLPFQFKIDILRELDYLIEPSHRYVISSKTISELKKIGKKIGKDGMAARLALKLVEANRSQIDIVESSQHVDDWIVEYSKANRAIACTNDSDLRKRLRALDIKVVTMKSKSKLGFV
ncbi:nucleotide-binding protein [Candidatus Micrarchaeota archaeon]|nr:nucleotide-binding protein [Candidatus Micrarchaeota archaeon]